MKRLIGVVKKAVGYRWLLIILLLLVMVYCWFYFKMLLPILLVWILLLLTENALFSFFTSFGISCFLFASERINFLRDVVRYLMAQVDAVIVGIIVMVAFLYLVISSDGGKQFQLLLRKIAKTKIGKFIAGGVLAGISGFDDGASIIGLNMLYRADIRSGGASSSEDKGEFVRIIVLLANTTATLIPISTWWAFYNKFEVGYSSIIPFLFYPIGVSIYYLYTFIIKPHFLSRRRGETGEYGRLRSEGILEKAKLKWWSFSLLYILPLALTLPILGTGFATGSVIGLTNDTLLLGVFLPGIFIYFVLALIYYLFSESLPVFDVSEGLEKLDIFTDKLEKIEKDSERQMVKMESDVYLTPTESRGRESRIFLNPGVLGRLKERLSLPHQLRLMLTNIRFYPKVEIPLKARWKNRLGEWKERVLSASDEAYKPIAKGFKDIIMAMCVLVGALALKAFLIKQFMNPTVMPNGVQIYDVDKILGTVPSFIPNIPQWLIPIAAYLFISLVGGAFGTAWGLFALFYPIFVILFSQLGNVTNPVIPLLTTGAIISASVYANQSCPGADTVMITSEFTGQSPEDILRVSKQDRIKCWGCSFLIVILYSLFHNWIGRIGLVATLFLTIALFACLLALFELIPRIFQAKENR
ncbi:MAG: hypothetical protein H8D67_18745 [Deltaproteobacteria bacterium]|nr:hypothetical protein [Deltaproteobacteria bacterium]